MSDVLWKQNERKLAMILGCKRVPVHSTSGVKSDLDHPWLAVECKERQSLPDWLTEAMQQAVRNSTEQKLPIVILHSKNKRHDDDLCILRLKDFCDWFMGEADK